MRSKGYVIGLSVCSSVDAYSYYLRTIQATKRTMKDSDGFSTACARKITWQFRKNDGVPEREIGPVVDMFLDPAHQLSSGEHAYYA